MTEPVLNDLLLDLDREDLRRVLTELSARHPELLPTMIALCTAAQSAARRMQSLPPVNLVEVQASLRTVLRAPASRYLGAVSGARASEAACPWIERAAAYQSSGDVRSALEILAVVADELSEAADALHDERGDLHRCLCELGRRLAQSLRSPQLSDPERKAWYSRVQIWERALGSWVGGSILSPALSE